MTGTIVQFLYESGLITTDSGPVVKLAGANLDRVLLMDVGLPPRATQIDLRKARSDMRNRGARESLCEQPIPEPERDLSGVSLRRARLDEGALISVDLSDADLREAALRGTRLAGSRLINANLSDAILTGADLRSADLRRTTLFDARLRGAKLTVAKLNGANLSGADLGEADLTFACLPRTKLSHLGKEYQDLNRIGKTELSRANLANAYLKEADLRQVKMTSVDLTDADLTDADLTDADLSGANLTGAIVKEEQLAECESLAGATMPNGQKWEDWLKSKDR